HVAIPVKSRAKRKPESPDPSLPLEVRHPCLTRPAGFQPAEISAPGNRQAGSLSAASARMANLRQRRFASSEKFSVCELRFERFNYAVTQPKKIFGTDGVRGVANVEPVTAETSLKLGRAAAHVFTQLNPRKNPPGTRPKIVLGKDTRLSGYMLENALVAGITSLGVDVLVIGPLPTPGVAYITRSLRADAGIILSASH